MLVNAWRWRGHRSPLYLPQRLRVTGSLSTFVHKVIRQWVDRTGYERRSRRRDEFRSLRSSDCSDRRIYESHLRQHDAAICNRLRGGDHTSITMQHSSNLLSWSGPVATGVFTDGNHALLYPTLVGEGNDPTISSGEPWLFYLDATTWPDWPSATIMYRRVQLSLR